jgi:hypothetical protein
MSGIFGHHKDLFICTNCRTVDNFGSATSGSFGIEVAVLIASLILASAIHWSFLFVCIIYSLWRASSRKVVCKSCQSDNKVPLSSPIGQKLSGQEE